MPAAVPPTPPPTTSISVRRVSCAGKWLKKITNILIRKRVDFFIVASVLNP